MVKLLLGEAGCGKTKLMIAKANEVITKIKGELVYMELTNKHASQLHTSIRCVFTEEYSLNSLASVYGFLCGLTSASHDVECIFIDGLDQILHTEIDTVVFEFMNLVNEFSVKNSIDVFISASVYSKEIIDGLEKYTKFF